MIGLQDFDVSRVVFIAAAGNTAVAARVRAARLPGIVMRGRGMIGVKVARKSGSHGAEKRHDSLEHRLDTNPHFNSYSTLSICSVGRNLLSAG
jgi:hypothetical protein